MGNTGSRHNVQSRRRSSGRSDMEIVLRSSRSSAKSAESSEHIDKDSNAETLKSSIVPVVKEPDQQLSSVRMLESVDSRLSNVSDEAPTHLNIPLLQRSDRAANVQRVADKPRLRDRRKSSCRTTLTRPNVMPAIMEGAEDCDIVDLEPTERPVSCEVSPKNSVVTQVRSTHSSLNKVFSQHLGKVASKLRASNTNWMNPPASMMGSKAQQSTILTDTSPCFGASSHIESYLRAFISTAVSHRQTAPTPHAGSPAGNTISKVEIMESKSTKSITYVPSVNVKGSVMKHNSLSAANFSKSSLASHRSSASMASYLSYESTDDELEREFKKGEATLKTVGKSEARKIRQNRKQQTFAFNLGDMTAETQDSSTEDVTKSSRRRSTTLELNKDALNLANKQRAEERAAKWKGRKAKMDRRRSEQIAEEQYQIARENRKRTLIARRRSTKLAESRAMAGLLALQKKKIITEITPEEDRDWCLEHQFMIQAFQVDEHAGFPFRQWLFEQEKLTQLELLGVWVEIERLRSTSQLGSELRSHLQYITYFKSLLIKCVQTPSAILSTRVSPVIREMLLQEDVSTIFDIPIAFISLQRDMFEELQEAYKEFVKCETRRMRLWTCDEKQSQNNKRRVSFAVETLDEMSHDDIYDCSQYNTALKIRMTRATQLTIDLVQVHKYKKISPEDNNYISDDNGNYTPEVVKPVYRSKKKLSIEQMYQNVKLEYPAKNYKYTHTELNTTDDYMRPIRKQGNIIQRPTVRPKSIKDILKIQIHFEFFRRFLKFNKVDKMLVFWKAIEIMKNTVNIRQRQVKAQNIMEKFFHDQEKKPCELLFCNAPIIMEIPGLEIVTTSMLFSAQRTILHQMEVDWFQVYMDTFPKAEVASVAKKDEGSNGAGRDKNAISMGGNALVCKGLRAALAEEDPALFAQQTGTGHKGHGKGHQQPHFNPLVADRRSILKTWIALCDWFRAAAKFIRCMESKQEYSLFSNFLTRIANSGVPGTVTDGEGNQVSSNTSVNKERKRALPAKQVICGQLITLVTLPNDLDFWIETDKFKNMFDQGHIETDLQSGKFNAQNQSVVLNKAGVIKECFLQPRWTPLVRDGITVTDSYINVPPDICETIIVSIQSGIIDNTIFADASSYVFPTLIHFWKIYREEYAKLAYSRWVHLTEELKVRIKQLKKAKERGRLNAERRRLHAPKAVEPPQTSVTRLDPNMVKSGDLLTKKSFSQLVLPIVMTEIGQIKQMAIPKYAQQMSPLHY